MRTTDIGFGCDPFGRCSAPRNRCSCLRSLTVASFWPLVTVHPHSRLSARSPPHSPRAPARALSLGFSSLDRRHRRYHRCATLLDHPLSLPYTGCFPASSTDPKAAVKQLLIGKLPLVECCEYCSKRRFRCLLRFLLMSHSVASLYTFHGKVHYHWYPN